MCGQVRVNKKRINKFCLHKFGASNNLHRIFKN
nr:MAG TPA: hypothetical protein [Caudoviricetes sp.]